MLRIRALALAGLAAALAGAAAAQEITIKAVSSFAEGTKDSLGFEALIAEINKRGAGKIKIQYLGGAPKVMNPFEVVKNLKDGVVDMANANSAFFTNVMPEADAFKLAEFGIADLRKNGAWDYMNKLLNEKANAYFLGNTLDFISFNIYLNKPIEKADLKGLKIRVTPIYRAMVEALGGTAINSPPAEVYTLMERGTVDGYGWPTSGIFDYSWEKVTKYRVEPSFYSAALHALVNLAVWNKLGAERQKIMQEAMAVVEARAGERLKLDDAERKRQEAAGIKAIQLPPAEAKKWSDTAKEAGWAAVIKTSPETGARLKELLTKK
ncbi:MAG: TRAP transporter substrate-binding protein DctP [Candidatus Odyssella sp.]|nr:TRAP transporter substrate-binding protein DctP [Candidatus Odyssella sp.]